MIAYEIYTKVNKYYLLTTVYSFSLQKKPFCILRTAILLDATKKMNIIVKFLICLASLVAIDSLRIWVLAKNIYRQWLAPYLWGNPNLRIWWLVRVIMVIWTIVFVGPRTQGQPRYIAFAYGALYGLTLYFVYNGTNAAFFAKRPWQVFLADCLRGMFACGIISVIRRTLSK